MAERFSRAAFALEAGHSFLKESTLRGPLDHVVGLLTGLLPDDVERDLQNREVLYNAAAVVGPEGIHGT